MNCQLVSRATNCTGGLCTARSVRCRDTFFCSTIRLGQKHAVGTSTCRHKAVLLQDPKQTSPEYFNASYTLALTNVHPNCTTTVEQRGHVLTAPGNRNCLAPWPSSCGQTCRSPYCIPSTLLFSQLLYESSCPAARTSDRQSQQPINHTRATLLARTSVKR